MPQLTTDARFENLGTMLEFVERSCRDSGAAQTDVFAFRLAADEVCTNIISYGYAGTAAGPISLEVCREGDRLMLSVGDRGTAFDPHDARAPDLESPWDVRAVGGLGLHLVRSLMDEVRYEPGGADGNRLTLVKRLSGGNPEVT